MESVRRALPEHSWTIALKGKLLRDLGQPREAIAILKDVPINAETADAAVQLAGALFEAGEIKAASETLSEALKYQPQDSATQLLKGRLLIEEGRAAEAIPVLQNTLQLEPDSLAAPFELGRAQFSCAHYSEAVRMFDLALEASPDWSEAAAAKARALFELPDFDAALNQARRALKLNPGDAEMLELIRNAARQLDRDEDALREMEIELTREPQSARAWYLKGSILLDRNDFDGAVKSLAKAADLDPRNADVRMTFSNALRLSGRYEEAGRECKSALECEPVTGYTLGWAGIYLGEVGEFRRACEVLAQATVTSPNVGWLWGSFGWALQYRDESSAAQSLDCYARAIQEDRNIWNVKGIADALALCERNDEAGQHFRSLMDEWPDTNDLTVLYVHGWSHYRLGDYTRAADLLKRSADISPDYIFARFDHALSILADGKLEQAGAAYVRAFSEIQRVNPMRQRGLLYVAAFDIAEGARHNRIPHAEDLLAHLRKRITRLWPNAPAMPWLANPWDIAATTND